MSRTEDARKDMEEAVSADLDEIHDLLTQVALKARALRKAGQPIVGVHARVDTLCGGAESLLEATSKVRDELARHEPDTPVPEIVQMANPDWAGEVEAVEV